MIRLRPLANVGLLFLPIFLLLWTAIHLEILRNPFANLSHTIPGKTSDFSPESRLHFLVIATSNDLNLCRLLLSASILSYPSPVLVDWAGEGEFNAAESHLAKIAGPLRYLESLPPTQDNDLILIVDGFDVIFQLGPDVLIKRYFSEIEAANNRLVARFGANHAREKNIYDSILFGPDKLCWPDRFNRAACWAVPDSSLQPFAFGPYTDKFMGDMPHARPRWLNSGTIMGPVRDLRKMFAATKALLKDTYNPEDVLRNSDQMYFADLWARQEVARTVAKGGREALAIPEGMEDAEVPVAGSNQQTEYHIGLDYTSALFQTAAGYSNYLAYMVFDRSDQASEQSTIEPYRVGLSQDILESNGPLPRDLDNVSQENSPWKRVPLVFNTVSGWVFPIFHFTGDKERRDYWWPRMWYAPQAESLHLLSKATYTDLIASEPINGIKWRKHEPYTVINESQKQVGWSIWSDRGQKLSWEQLCKEHETNLYNTKLT